MTVVTLSYKLVTSNTSRVSTSGASTSSGSGQGTARLIGRGSNLGNRTGQTYKLGDKAASEKAKQGAAARASDRGRAKDEPVNTVAEQATETNNQTPVVQPVASSVSGGVILQDTTTKQVFYPTSSGYSLPLASTQPVTNYSGYNSSNPFAQRNRVIDSPLRKSDNTGYTESQKRLNEAIERSQERINKRDEAFKSDVKNIEAIAPKIPFVKEGFVIVGSATPYLLSAAPSAVEKAYLSGRALVAGKEYKENLGKESLRAEDIAIKETGYAATLRNPEGNVTRESVVGGALIYGGALATTFKPKVQSVKSSKPKTVSDINEAINRIKTDKPFVSPKTTESGISGFGQQTKQVTVTQISPIAKLFGRKPTVNKYDVVSDYSVSGSRNLASKEAKIDIVGRSTVKDSSGTIIKQEPFSARGVQFQGKKGTVTGIGDKNAFSVKVDIKRTKINEVEVPVERGFGYGGEYEIFTKKKTTSTTSRFETASIKNPSSIIGEGKVNTESTSVLSVTEKPFTSQKKTTMTATKRVEVRLPGDSTGLQKGDGFFFVEEPVVIKDNVNVDNVLVSKNRKTLSVSKSTDDPFALSTPSSSYAKAYEKLYGKKLIKDKAIIVKDKTSTNPYAKELYNPATGKKEYYGYDKVIDFPEFLENQAKVKLKLKANDNKREALKARFDSIKLKDNKVSAKSVESISREGTVVVSKDPFVSSKVRTSTIDTGFFDFAPKIKLGRSPLITNLVTGISSTVGSTRRPIVAPVINNEVQVTKAISLPKNIYEVSSASVQIPKVEKKTFILSKYDTALKTVQEQEYKPVIPIAGISTPRPTSFFFPPLSIPSGGLGGSYGREGRGSKQKYAYTPSLTGIEARVVGSGKATGNTGIKVRGISKKQLAILEGRGKSFVRF